METFLITGKFQVDRTARVASCKQTLRARREARVSGGPGSPRRGSLRLWMSMLQYVSSKYSRLAAIFVSKGERQRWKDRLS